MALRDEIRRERQAVAKNGTLKDKWDYFTEYYLVRTVAIIAAVVLGTYMIYDILTKPDVILNGLFLNTYNYDKQEDSAASLEETFTKHLGISSDKEVAFSSNLTLTGDLASDYQTSQAMTVQAAAETLDFVVSPKDKIVEYAYGGMFENLGEILSPEQLETYKPYLLYIDMAVYEAREKAMDDGGKATDIPIPDPAKPDAMERPIPIFIDVTHSKKVTACYGYKVDSLVFGISVNAPNPENICKFVEYIMQE